MSQNSNQDQGISAESIGKGVDSFFKERGKKVGAAILAITMLVGGIFFLSNKSEQNSASDVETELPAGEEEDIKVPREAKDFVDQYKTIYGGVEDTVSVYYAKKALEKEYTGKSFVFDTTNEIVNKYVFDSYNVHMNMEVSQENSIKIFNEYTSVELTLYMNLLAKNPEMWKELDKNFKDACSDNLNDFNPKLAFTADDEIINNLMNFAKSIVNTYGSSANYRVEKATTEYSDDKTIFKSYDVTQDGSNQWGDQNLKVWSDGGIDLRITVDQYNGSDHEQSIKTFSPVQLTVMQQRYLSDDMQPDSFVRISIGSEK